MTKHNLKNPLTDLLDRPIFISDDIVIHDFGNKKSYLTKVIGFATNSPTVYVDCNGFGFKSSNCIVVTEQVESNKIKYPEYQI